MGMYVKNNVSNIEKSNLLEDNNKIDTLYLIFDEWLKILNIRIGEVTATERESSFLRLRLHRFAHRIRLAI